MGGRVSRSIPPDERSLSGTDRDSRESYDSIEESLAEELAGFQKIVNAIRLYGEDHDFAVSQAGSFLASLRPLLDELGELPLQVHHDALRYEGVPVIADRDQVGLADALYRDGVRTLTLRAGLSAEEFLELLAILGTNLLLPRHREDTLQGLLWKANLPHVGYEPIQKIEEAIEDSEDAARGESFDFGEICQRLFFSGGDPGSGGAYFAPAGATAARMGTRPEVPVLADGDEVSYSTEWRPDGEDSFDDDDVPQPVEGDVAGGSLGPRGDGPDAAGEAARLGVGARPAAGAGGWHAMVAYQETLEFLDGRRDRLDVPERFVRQIDEVVQAESLAHLLDRAVTILLHSALVGSGELAGVAPLLEACLRRGAEVGLTERYRRTVEVILGWLEGDVERVADRMAAERLVRALTGPDLIVAYAAHVAEEDHEAAAHLDRVVELAGPDVLGQLVAVAAGSDDRQLREVLVGRIVQGAQAHPAFLVSSLRTADVPSVLVRLEALSRIEDIAAQDQLAGLLEHGDPRVRAAVVERLPRERLKPLLRRVVGMLAADGDPEVRCAVIRRLEQEQVPARGSVLARMASAESFHRRETSEKELVLQALARCGEQDALQPLTALLRLRVNVGSRKQAESRRLAALALARLGGARAHHELHQAAKAWDPGLSRDAREALRVHRGSTDE